MYRPELAGAIQEVRGYEALNTLEAARWTVESMMSAAHANVLEGLAGVFEADPEGAELPIAPKPSEPQPGGVRLDDWLPDRN